MFNEKKYIFGLGTGRCGTVSLTELFNIQNSSFFSHEMGSRPYLPWDMERVKIVNRLFELSNNKNKFVGDVAFFLLPYINEILKYIPESKFVILQRDKKETISSYMKKTEGRNHWVKHNGNIWQNDSWDVCYPKFYVDSKKEALAEYYDLYYKLCRKIPEESCFWMNTEDLNNKEISLQMLEWCGFDDPRYSAFKENRSKN